MGCCRYILSTLFQRDDFGLSLTWFIITLIFPLNYVWLAFNLWNNNNMPALQQDKHMINSKIKIDHYQTFLPDWWWFLSPNHMHWSTWIYKCRILKVSSILFSSCSLMPHKHSFSSSSTNGRNVPFSRSDL